jgi:hypothetical protein
MSPIDCLIRDFQERRDNHRDMRVINYDVRVRFFVPTSLGPKDGLPEVVFVNRQRALFGQDHILIFMRPIKSFGVERFDALEIFNYAGHWIDALGELFPCIFVGVVHAALPFDPRESTHAMRHSTSSAARRRASRMATNSGRLKPPAGLEEGDAIAEIWQMIALRLSPRVLVILKVPD